MQFLKVVSLLPFSLYVPALRRLSNLRGYISDLLVYAVKNAGEFDYDRFNQSLFKHFDKRVIQGLHRRLPEQTGEQGNERHANNGNAAPGH